MKKLIFSSILAVAVLAAVAFVSTGNSGKYSLLTQNVEALAGNEVMVPLGGRCDMFRFFCSPGLICYQGICIIGDGGQPDPNECIPMQGDECWALHPVRPDWDITVYDHVWP